MFSMRPLCPRLAPCRGVQILVISVFIIQENKIGERPSRIISPPQWKLVSAIPQPLSDRSDKFSRAGVAALIGSQDSALAVGLLDGGFELVRLFRVAEVAQEQRAGEQHGGGIDKTRTGQVRRGAVDRLEVGVARAIAAAGSKTEAAYAASGDIGQDITVLVGEHHHVQRLRGCDHAAGKVIDKKFIVAESDSSPRPR